MKTLRILLPLLAFAALATAQEIDEIRPACAAEGDRVVLCGSDFADEPTVTFGDTAAEVIRSNSEKILVRVPEGVAVGDLTVDVDGATADFEVLAEGAPVVLFISAEKANPGAILFLYGKRLNDADAEFVDGDAVVGTAELRGGRHAAYLKVPADLAAGTYSIVITNGSGEDSGSCSPELEVVEPGDATLDEIAPEGQLPGRPVVLNGANLGSFGFVEVVWTPAEGDALTEFGFSNGFDRVWSWIPYDAEEGATYDVHVDLGDAGASNAVAYEVGSPSPPMIDELEFDEGEAGTILGIKGTGFLNGRELPTVTFAAGDVSEEARVKFVQPGFGPFGGGDQDTLYVEVPDLEDGDYDVTVTVGDRTSNAVVFTVTDLPLEVTSMSPTSQGPNGPREPVTIEGTGFGGFGGDPLEVTWDDGEKVRKGLVIFRTGRELLVIPPGDGEPGNGGIFFPFPRGGNALPAGEYTVTVTLNPGTDAEESAEAGTYTVNE